MKKLFLLVTTILLAFTITACGGDDDPVVVDDGLTSISISGTTDRTIMVDDVFNVFTGVVATGSDGLDYSDQITADSDNCTIGPDGTLTTTIQATCIVNYAVVVDSKLDTAVATITIDKEDVVVDDNAPLLKGWTFDDATALDGWGIYTNGTGSIVESVEEGALKLVTTSGGLVYETRLDFMGIAFEVGTDYVISFKAKSDIDGKGIHMQLGQLLASDPWFIDFKPGQVDDFYLTTEWAEYSFSFTMTLNNIDGGILFEMGNMADSENLDATIWVDDIEIRGGSGLDNPPVITGIDDVTVVAGKAFDTREGVTVIDSVDGNLFDSLHVFGDSVNGYVPGVYTASYYVRDTAGNRVIEDRVITVVEDTEAPVFTGTDNSVVPLNSDFDPMAGVMAMDNGDGDVTDSVVVTGTADATTPGDYTLTYTVTDRAGNSVTVDRLITVTDMVFLPTDLITNGSFDLVGWNTWMADWNSTNASASFLDGAAVIDITDVGSENWNIQLFQEGMTFVNGTQYTVTFDAMSTVARDINVKLIAASEFTQMFSLTTEMDTYTYTFTFTDEDGEGKLDFELGGAQGGILVSVPSVVTIDNVMVEEFDGTAVVADSDQILNGDFATSPFDGWYTWARDWDPVISHSVVVNGGVAEFTYNGIGDAIWQVQFGQGDIAFEYGETYKVTFDAKADAPKDFLVDIYDGSRDFLSPTLTLGTEWASYEYILTWDSEALAKLQFVFGLTGDPAGGVFFIDNVEIGILDQPELIVNGEFDLLGHHWDSWMADWNSTDASVSYLDGAAVIDITDVGVENWNIQLFQEGMTFVNGTQYTVTFDAMSTVARDINVKLIAASEFTQMFSLTTEMDTYTYTFTFTDEDGEGKLDFELGGAQGGILVSVPSVVTIDNVKVEEFDGTAVVADTNQTLNGNFEQMVSWGSWMADWNSTAATVTYTDGTAVIDITDVGVENWNIQLFQEGLNLTNQMEYTVQFDAMSTVARDINVKMIGTTEYTEMVSLTTEMVTYSFTFVYLEADGENKLDFELGGAMNGILVSVPSVVTIDNVIIYVDYN